MKTLKITSDAFEEGGKIPARFTCDGANINPALTISGIPQGTVSLALVVDDPDAASGDFVHWVVWNIPATGQINENSVPGEEGKNDFGKNHYKGPCPPPGIHHYHFKIFALDKEIDLPPGSTKQDLINAIKSHTLASGELMGIYQRK